MDVAVGLLLLSWALLGWFDRQAIAVAARRIAPALVLFSLAISWAVLQTSSLLPQGLWHPLWHDLALVSIGGGSVSLDPSASRDGVLRLMAYGGIFLLALQHGRTPQNAGRLVKAVAIAGSLYAFYGLAEFLSGSETILWMDKWAYHGVLTSTFVNRNNYATYAGLTLLCLAAVAARHLSGQGRRGVLRLLVVDGDRLTWFVVVGGVVMLAALLCTGSRAGCVATLVGLASFTVALRQFRGARLIGGLVAVVLAGFFLLGLPDEGGAASSEFGDRIDLYRLTLDAIGDRPWTGTGLGSFPAMFAMFRPHTFMGVWDNVHNTYLQLLLELGIVAAGCQFAAVGWLVWLCVKGVKTRRRDLVFPALGVAASVLVGGHALVDFSLEIPAVAATYAGLLGMAVAQSWSRSESTAQD